MHHEPMTPPNEKPPLESLRELRADTERMLTGQEREDALRNIDDMIRGYTQMDALKARQRRGNLVGRALSLLIGLPIGGWAIFQGFNFVITGDGSFVPWLLAALFVTAGGVIAFVSMAHVLTGRDLSGMRIGPPK
jgi:hypothetical protein